MGYKEIISKLQKQVDENNRQIIKLTKDKDVLISCQSGINNTLSLFYSVIPYFALFGIISFMYSSGSISIPTELSACIITGGSLATAAVCNTILTRKSRKKLKKKYTETENLEETIGLLIEIEKLNNKNKALQTTIDKIKNQKKQKEAMANWVEHLEVQIKETVSEDSEEYTKQIQKLKKELDEKYQELDTITTKKDLHKYPKSKSTLKKALLVATLFTCYATAPILLRFTAKINEIRTPLQILITLLTPLTISTATCALYINKQNTNLKTALINLEKNLSTNQKVDKTIEQLINEISQTEFDLQEQKKKYEIVETNKKNVYEYNFDKNQTINQCEKPQNEKVYSLRIPKGR